MQSEVFILDSNIRISYVITKQLQTLVAMIHNHQLTVLTSEHMVEEIQGVLLRPKFKKYLNALRFLYTLHF